MYTGQIRVPSNPTTAARSFIEDEQGIAKVAPQEVGAQHWEQEKLIQLYIFADRRGVLELRNDVMTKIIKDGESLYSKDSEEWELTTTFFDHVSFSFDNLPKGSTLLCYLITEAAWFWEDFHFANRDLESLPAEFTAGVLNQMPTVNAKKSAGVRNHAPWRENLCLFHEHSDTNQASRCARRHRTLQAKLKAKISFPLSAS